METKEITSSVVYGRQPVRAFLESPASTPEKLYIAQNAHGPEITAIIALSKQRKVPFHFVPQQKLGSLVRGTHQGVVLIGSSVRYLALTELLAIHAKKPFSGIVVLDEVVDPHNIGAIARSAALFGFSAIVIGKFRAGGVTPATLKASAGALQSLYVARVPNVSQSLAELKKCGFWIYGADMSGTNIAHVQFNTPVALVMSGEHKGLRSVVRSQCDDCVAIPHKAGAVDSLNVSVAAGIIMHRIYMNLGKFPVD